MSLGHCFDASATLSKHNALPLNILQRWIKRLRRALLLVRILFNLDRLKRLGKVQENSNLQPTQRMTKNQTLLATVSSTLMLVSFSARANYNFETFNTDLAGWTYTNPGGATNGSTLGWNNSANSGGAAGEIGGTLARVNVPTSPTALGMPRILDTSTSRLLGLTLNTAISVSGKMYLGDPGTADTGIYIGYFNTAAPDVQRLALRIDGPSAHPQWRARFASGWSGSGTTGTRTAMAATFNATALDFSFSFAPSGLNDGAGTLTGSIYNVGTAETFTVTAFSILANANSFDAFGIWGDSSGSSDITRVQTAWFDNLTYTVVPEPAAALLLPFGAGLLLLARNKTRRA